MSLRFSLVAALAALVALPALAQAPLRAPAPDPFVPQAARGGGFGDAFTGVLLGTKEVPANASPARGYAYGEFDAATGALSVFVPVSGLTGDFQAAHIHQGAAGSNGPVLFPATNVFANGDDVEVEFDVTLTPAQVTLLQNGELYVNVHSSAFPGGEVRTQLGASLTLEDVRATALGETVTTLAYVARAKGAFTYLNDGFGGLTVRQTAGPWFDAVQSGQIAPGTIVRVTGALSEFRGLLQINQVNATTNNLASFEIANDVGVNVNLFAAQVTLADIAANGEQLEGVLVVVPDVTLAAGAGGTFGPGTNVAADDGSAPVTPVVVRVPSANDTDVDGLPVPTSPVVVLGIVGQFTSATPPTDGYQLLVIESYDVDPQAQAQIIHNAPDPALATVDVFVDGALAVDDLSFRAATGLVSLPAYTFLPVEVRDATGTTILIEAAAVLVPGGAPIRIVALGVGNPALFAANPDGIPTNATLAGYFPASRPQTASQVSLLAVHGTPDAPQVDLRADNLVLVDDLIYTDAAARTVSALNYVLDVTSADGSAVVGSFQADLTSLGGQRATVLASGFLDPAANQNGPAFGLLAVLEDGTSFLLPRIVAAGEGAAAGLALGVAPNPAAGAARVAFALDAPAEGSLAVYDALGRRVAVLAEGTLAAGPQTADVAGLAPGVYVVRLTAGDRVATRTLTVVR